MNLQKDLIQHIAVLTVAPGYLNFSEPRSSDILHVGLEETKQMLRDCLGILAAEDTGSGLDIFEEAEAARQPVLRRYAQVFREACQGMDALRDVRWKDDLEARYDIDPVISGLDAFLGAEHWYEIDHAQLIRFSDGTFYCDCSRSYANFVTNWRCASMFSTQELVECVCGALAERFGKEGEAVSASSFDPPKDFLWRARTYAPQSPQSMINYWEAVLPGARRVRIKQMVGQVK